MDKTNLFGITEESMDSIYTTKVEIPQYLPKNICPSIYDLYSTIKYDDLKNNILKANITEEQKEFLLTAASRHIVFNYSKIADYYAHQSKEMQELMEESALVLIDMDDAISKGYVRLSENLQKLLNKQLEKE